MTGVELWSLKMPVKAGTSIELVSYEDEILHRYYGRFWIDKA